MFTLEVVVPVQPFIKPPTQREQPFFPPGNPVSGADIPDVTGIFILIEVEVEIANLESHMCKGTKSFPETKLHINLLEMKVVLLSVKEFLSLVSGKIVCL